MWIFLAIDEDSAPIESSVTEEDLLARINDYMGAHEDYKFQAKLIENKRLEYTEFEGDLINVLTYEETLFTKVKKNTKIYIWQIWIDDQKIKAKLNIQ